MLKEKKSLKCILNVLTCWPYCSGHLFYSYSNDLIILCFHQWDSWRTLISCDVCVAYFPGYAVPLQKEIFCRWEGVNKDEVEKREFVWEFSQLSRPGQTRTRVTWELTSESLYESCMRVDESWQARVCLTVFSTFVSRLNENKSRMRVDESWQERVCMRVFSTLMSWFKSCTRVEFINIFVTLPPNEYKSVMYVWRPLHRSAYTRSAYI